MILPDEREEILSGDLPDRLYCIRARGVGHIDEDCQAIRQFGGGRWVSTEYLRRAGARLCSLCGDGRTLGEEL